jgi:DNA processing protein
LERDEIAAWLRLIETPGVGRESARRLLLAFGCPSRVFDASPAAWRAHVGARVAAALEVVPSGLEALVRATLDWRSKAGTQARHIIALGDAAYPQQLLHTADPPLLLYAVGRAELLNRTSVALVGSRNPTPQGVENARDFSRALSDTGLCVVSGLALGIDAAAHEGALDGIGSTIAVVGTGLDRVYPRRHLDLAHRIAAHGLLLSEFSLGSPPLPDHFPRRNRIIAGLSQGTLVVEAAVQSGSLITARLASDAGRDVYAIPGSIHSPQSRGCHALIKQGAMLVDSAQDILQDLAPKIGIALPATVPLNMQDAPDSTPGDPLLDALGHDAVTLDALALRTGIAPAELSARLLDLELEGQVTRMPGQLFQRIFRA